MNKSLYLFTLFLFTYTFGSAQADFHIEGNKKKFNLSFEQVNNLVIIPVELNGVKLSFLLDTGVNSTVLFNLPENNDSIEIKNASRIWIKGMGLDKPVEGIKSEGNTMKIGKAINNDFTYYTVYEKHISLSQRMGLPIHGIIGYDFFKDFIFEFRYLRNKIKIHNPEVYKYKKCRRCEEFDLRYHKNKPYITLKANINQNPVSLNLLVDSGSSDALWLFQNEKKGIKIPDSNFPDFLGHGFGGSIYGSRSRIGELNFGKYSFKEVTASFPDTTYTEEMETFIHRDGSLGAQILRRFKVILDYQGKQVRLKPNRKFNDPFEYDMSGVAIAHKGYDLTKVRSRKPAGNNVHNGTQVNKGVMEVKYFFEPEYEIVEVRPKSPAEESGLKIGDVIKKINRKPAHNFSLEEIINLFSSEEGKKIRLKVERDGFERSVTFELERIL